MSRASRRPGPGAFALLVLALAALLWGGDCSLAGDDGEDGEDGEPAGSEARGQVTRVVDGDTVEVELDGEEEDLRYIGVDTPESVKPDTPVECYALRASHFNERLVEGREVRLVFDGERRDDYGRLLAYVYVGDTFVNEELLRRGLATTLAIEPNTSFAARFERVAQGASGAGRGLWSAC